MVVIAIPLGNFRSDLIACLKRLAAPAEEQVRYLKGLGVYPSADELALELNEFALLARAKVVGGELSFAEKAAIDRLDAKLASFSGNKNSELWTAPALASHDAWQVVRGLAAECLKILEQNSNG